jgi:hypothetical protein
MEITHPLVVPRTIDVGDGGSNPLQGLYRTIRDFFPPSPIGVHEPVIHLCLYYALELKNLLLIR